MLPIIVGTVRNTVNLAVMDNKWQQKKESGRIFEKELTPQQRQIEQFKEDLKKMRENNELASIANKMKSGDKLTAEELEYLQRNNPELYRQYVEIQQEKEAYKRELESCKTKDEVEKVRINKMNGLLSAAKSVSNNPNIPEGAKLALMEQILMKAMGIQEVHMEFVKTAHYQELPTDEEVSREAEEKVEQKEEVVAEIGENAKEDTEVMEEIQENVVENEEITEQSKSADDNIKSTEFNSTKIELPELKQKADTAFEETKKEAVQYIKEHRPSGFGMEYLDDELNKVRN